MHFDGDKNNWRKEKKTTKKLQTEKRLESKDALTYTIRNEQKNH